PSPTRPSSRAAPPARGAKSCGAPCAGSRSAPPRRTEPARPARPEHRRRWPVRATTTILVPLDRSVGSEAVPGEVARLARAEGARVRLLHVARPVDALMVDGRVVRYADQEVARVREDCRASLIRAAAALADLEVDIAVRFGDPVEEIVREAAQPG